MKDSMHRMKSKELEVSCVLRWQRWMKNKKRREQRIKLDFKCGGNNVDDMGTTDVCRVLRYFFLQHYGAT